MNAGRNDYDCRSLQLSIIGDCDGSATELVRRSEAEPEGRGVDVRCTPNDVIDAGGVCAA